MQTVPAEVARKRILFGGSWDEPFRVEGDLDFAGITTLIELPAQLRHVWELNAAGCTGLTHLPDAFEAHSINLSGCTALTRLPAGLKAHSLVAAGSGLTSLPADLQVTYKIDLTNCKMLRSLPDHLSTGALIVRGCTNLEALPDELSFYTLDASNCTRLKTWGARGKTELGIINLSGCRALTSLPDWLNEIIDLDISGCTALEALPESLVVTGNIELADSGLRGVPPGASEARLRWRSVIIDERVAFRPETITAKDVMKQANIELRRVMLERMGYEAFFKQANAQELDRDFDPGGLRRLLRVEFKDDNRRRDEPVVCLSVICPSTARHYIIRVPPSMTSCHRAAAWIAGFDDPDQYRPVMET